MQQLLLIAIAAAVLCCAMLAPAFKSSLLRPRDLPRRLVILPVGGEDCERLEARLIYERDRARREGNAVLFLLEREPGEEAREIARHFCRGEPDLFCGDAAGLRAAIGDDAVYKVVEIVLY